MFKGTDYTRWVFSSTGVAVTRNLARIVKIDAISPIEKADAIEVAHVGGWKVVVRKGKFRPGDLAVYFEIDSFLPEGNPAWRFLVDKSACVFEDKRGHVLRSVKLRGQVSQGLLLSLAALKGTSLYGAALQVGDSVAEALGVLKYERPIPACLEGQVRGAFPSRVPKSDQERIQNLANELTDWRRRGVVWEVTEKLEGTSCTFAWLDNELHVCSRTLNLAPTEGNSFWGAAKALGIHEKLERYAGDRNIALQGELVGFGIQGNIYKMNGQAFYLYDVYDVDAARYLRSPERLAIAQTLDIPHVPVIDASFAMDENTTVERLLAMADGESQLRTGQRREGLVFKALTEPVSFKAISNQYLLNQKD